MTSTPLFPEKVHEDYLQSSLELLKDLIRTPSVSKSEGATADLIENFLNTQNIPVERKHHNVWARSRNYQPDKPTLLLNSHHDTVKPNAGYTLNPFEPIEKETKLYGLGSNDAGASLVSLLHVFLYFYEAAMPLNIIFSATAEEEISGENGLSAIISDLGAVDFAIVGEPTGMRMAFAEKGLMVLDGYAKGKSSHTARDEGENAIYVAMQDIDWFRSYQFEKVSPILGPVKMNVTMIEAGYQHNMIPDHCHFVVDVRTTPGYTNLEILETIKEHTLSELIPRSTRLNPSGLSEDHLLVQAAKMLNLELFGSPTLSDQSLMPFPSCKIGPGVSERSHTADEFVYVKEIKIGIKGYIDLINTLNNMIVS
jgi:acetylornithine deacetylase